MNKKTLYIIIAVLVLVIIVGAVYLLSNRSGGDTRLGQPEVSGEPAATVPLSEEPLVTKYDEYFSELYLGKLPKDAEFDPTKVSRSTVFGEGEQFCTVMTLTQQVPSGSFASAVYDVNAKQNVQPKSSFPQKLGPGGVTGCSSLEWSKGAYEQKVYIDDILVAVMPFEVK